MYRTQRLKSFFFSTISQNALANGVRTFLQILIAFLGNYFIVRMATKEELAIWSLVFVFANFLNLADFGVSNALVRYIANDEKNRFKYFWTAFCFYLFAGSIGIFILFILRGILGNFFFKDINPSFYLLLFALLGSLLTLLGSTITSTLNGLQRMKRSSAIEVFKSFIHYLIILSFFKSVGILAFGIGFFVSNLLSMILGFVILSKKAFLPFILPQKIIFINLFSFGVKSFGIQIVNQIKGAWLKLLASNILPIEYVTFTDYTEKIIGYFRQMLLSLILPLMPAAASFHAIKDNKNLTRLYKTSLLILFGVGLFSCLSFVLLVPYLIRFWLGEGFEPVILSSQIICFAVFFNLLTGPGYSVLQGIGRQLPLLITAISTLFMFLIFTAIFALNYGFNGIFIGNVIAESLATIGFLFWFWKKKPIKSY